MHNKTPIYLEFNPMDFGSRDITKGLEDSVISRCKAICIEKHGNGQLMYTSIHRLQNNAELHCITGVYIHN